MTSDLNQVRANISTARGVIERIRHVSGAPGIAIGIIHGGAIIHEDYHGHRDVQLGLPVNRDTIFHVASLTKGITAPAVAILVEHGDLEWDTPVGDILQMNDAEKAKITVADLMSHRTGVTWADALYLQSNNNILLPKSESLRTFEYLRMVAQPRSQFLYNNHGYNIPGLIIEALSKQPYGEFVKQKIFDPLGMTRTSTAQPNDPNVAIPYNILSDGTPFQIPFSESSDETMMFSGIAVRTCMADLLRLYHAYLQAMKPFLPENMSTESSSSSLLTGLRKGFCNWFSWLSDKSSLKSKDAYPDDSKSGPSVIREVQELLRPHITRSSETLYEQTYALGWHRSQLPAKLDFGWNSWMISSMPLLGSALQGKLAIWHGGNMPGTTAAVILLPETATGVVVLQNSLGLCDAADLISQLLIDCLFAGRPQHDYVTLANEAALNGRQRMDQVQSQLDREQQKGTTHRSLEEYIGVYENAIKNWSIEIGIADESNLFLRFQRRLDEEYKLRHYNHDVFVWNISYDDLVKRAQYCRPYSYYKFEFEPGSDGSVSFLRWRHDPYVPEGEIFEKAEASDAAYWSKLP